MDGRSNVVSKRPRIGGRRRSRMALPAVLAVAVLVASGCNTMVLDAVQNGRARYGKPALTSSPSLARSAKTHSDAMCASGTVARSSSPSTEYDLETFTAVYDVVGSAELDPTIADPEARRNAARQTLIDSGATNATFIEDRWTHVGIGETFCSDGKLYLTTVLGQRPTMPSTGRYAVPQYTSGQVQRVANIQYGTAPNYLGQPTALMLDLWQPPAAGAPLRPAMILIHGGGFAGGSRDVYAGTAVDLAARGYVVISISYRLRPGDCCGPTRQLAAAADAIDDGMEAVRWLKANAATYRIDTTRIGALGSSAGGVIALGLALGDDQTPTGPLAAHSPSIAAAVSTGGHLTPGLPILNLRGEQPAVQMFLHEDDPSAGPWTEGSQTCEAVRTSGNTCDLVIVPGTGHTSWISPGSAFWSSDVGPFLWHHLRLATAT